LWEAYGLKNKDLLWAGTTFRGGIAGQQQAPCGAVSAAAIALGLRHRCYNADKKKAEQARNKACEDAAELVKSFEEKYGAITCYGLLGIDLRDEEAMKRAREAGIFEEKCQKQVQFVIEKLYEIEKKRSPSLKI
jgi:C_GCAxxG_C_C family probable redox protein